MPAEDTLMVASYDYRLVALSVFVSILGAYAARDLCEQIRAARGRTWLAWLIGSAAADGIATWSMHYTGMLALNLPVPVQYDWPTVLLSLLVGIVGSAAALAILGLGRVRLSRAWAASILLGCVGISGLHFVAMGAMRFRGMHHYKPALEVVSVVLAIVISGSALSLPYLFTDTPRGRRLRNHCWAVLRGMANPAMHYTAMAATVFTYSDTPADLSHAVSIESLGVVGITVVPLLLLIVALLTTLADRVQKQRALLDELFEQAPQAVALMSADNRVVRVNREFTLLFGYTKEETIGRALGDLIIPDEARDEDQRFADMVARGRRVEAEGVRLSKHGKRLDVAILRVPVAVPGGQIESYAIYRDIVERKRAEETLRTSAGLLQVLSRRLIEVQEEERRHLALELHDEIGQILVLIGMNLQTIQRHCGADVQSRLQETIGIVDRAIDLVRTLALDLRPPILDDLGLVAALRWLVDHQARSANLIEHLDIQTSGSPLPANLATACFRVAQAALTNAAKHARARHVWVELRQGESELVLTVRDDGVGFDPREARRRATRGESLGLLGIQERVEMLGGQVAIESEPGRGTIVRARFPLD
jgi:two-component system sensor histidine kinase UhpB